ncbi:DNA recombination protein RmuC [Frondihabitans sp. VKM Ac-2883]|uniref:DNA recombination protein RmuC n=1 Tax=Frondihabitans sp. VKM Ac-2883 TaxID=2783823 RepID=UPI00188B20B4|nr:DNA recombination protein RmuC [Frondihabitans sp. VKM Ac-2883]MBF4577639.1 DNA recombination protein RmuC [Frondihabitans sp. VKM Ac-2883]
MSPVVALLLGLLTGAVAGLVIGRLLLSARAAAADSTAAALRDRVAAQEELHARQLEQQEQRVDELHDRLIAAAEAETRRSSSDGRVLTALSPVAESLRAVQLKVAELEQQRHRQHGELSEQLRSAAESEERLRSTAESLAAALKSNSTRGVWGETQLRNVVQAAGLLERVDFDVQTGIVADSGARRPDMVIHLPGGKNIAVDAKVPFSAYLKASSIPATATGAEFARRGELLREHVKAVRAHIDALSSKAYWSGLESSPELTIAFIPSESLVSSALEADPSVMDYAFQKKVALASPVTLWSVLKTIAFSWQQDVVTQEAKQLFDLSRELYGRLSTMATHVDKLGRSIRGTVTDYNRFVGSLERQVLPSARRLSVLDESTVIAASPPIDDVPRDLAAPELTAVLDDAPTLGAAPAAAVPASVPASTPAPAPE